MTTAIMVNGFTAMLLSSEKPQQPRTLKTSWQWPSDWASRHDVLMGLGQSLETGHLGNDDPPNRWGRRSASDRQVGSPLFWRADSLERMHPYARSTRRRV